MARVLLTFALALASVAACDEPEPDLRPIPMERSSSGDEDEAEPGEPEEEDEPTSEGTGLVDDALAAQVRGSVALVRGRRTVMGTAFEISVAGMEEERAAPLIELALDEIGQLEAILSEWQEGSEISAINRAAGSPEPVTVSDTTFGVVSAGVDVSRWSDGAFDLSWAALRGLYLFQPNDRHIPPLGEVRERLAFVDWEAIELDREARTVRLARGGMAIGTGGIAKGYALDRAGAILREGGAESYMMYGGGQVQVQGTRGDRPWRVGIQHPRDPATYVGFLEITSGSMSTSGDYEHAFVDETGTHWHHIIDLSTGLPARRSMQVTLLAAEGIRADALSTAAFVLGPERALQMLAEVPGAPEAVIVDHELRVHMTPGIAERLVWRVELEDGRLPGTAEFSSWER